MEMEELISIIVPIYQVEQYLEQCIQSIQNQTYKNIEIILVDDGSDDQCPQICDHYAQNDKRIKVIHKKNGGLDSARKAGISAATGKYVGYIDGDDWIEPQMYERLFEYACINHVDVVESGVIDSYENVEKKRTPYLNEGCYKGKKFVEEVETRILYTGSFYEHGISPYLCSKLFLREKIMKYQMTEDLINRLHDDIMVAMPCIAETKSLYISHDCYYHYRIRRDSLKRKCNEDEVPNLMKCLSGFYDRFKGTKLCMKNDRQIEYYAMYYLLFMAPAAFDNLSSNTFLTPFGGLDIKNKIVLYGAGAAGIHLESYIQSVEGSNILCWADCNYKDLSSSMNVVSPKEIIHYEYDYIVISILRASAVQSAKRDLIDLGIPKEKILWIEQRYIDAPKLLLSKVVYQGKALVEREALNHYK